MILHTEIMNIAVPTSEYADISQQTISPFMTPLLFYWLKKRAKTDI